MPSTGVSGAPIPAEGRQDDRTPGRRPGPDPAYGHTPRRRPHPWRRRPTYALWSSTTLPKTRPECSRANASATWENP
jgi:hypothetical protein